MNKELIHKAAAFLAEEAQALQESCMVGEKKWACADCHQRPCAAELRYEDMATTASKLKEGDD